MKLINEGLLKFLDKEVPHIKKLVLGAKGEQTFSIDDSGNELVVDVKDGVIVPISATITNNNGTSGVFEWYEIEFDGDEYRLGKLRSE